MPKRKKIDTKLLIEMVEMEFSTSDIMEKFGFGTKAQFQNHYLNALMAEGKVPAISTKRGPRKAATPKITVNKRGSLIVPKNIVSDMGYSEGSRFVFRRTKAGISLRFVE